MPPPRLLWAAAVLWVALFGFWVSVREAPVPPCDCRAESRLACLRGEKGSGGGQRGGDDDNSGGGIGSYGGHDDARRGQRQQQQQEQEQEQAERDWEREREGSKENPHEAFSGSRRGGGRGPSGAKLVMAVLNGGNRTTEYFERLHASLLPLTDEYGLFVYSDVFNFRASRGDYRQPSLPTDLLFDQLAGGKKHLKGRVSKHQWRLSMVWYGLVGALLAEHPQAEAFFITENDAEICDAGKLRGSFEYFLEKDGAVKSLSYWDSCKNKVKAEDPVATKHGIKVYRKQPCGMVATLFTRSSLQKVWKTMDKLIFTQSIEGIHSASGTLALCVENGSVLIHGGSVSTEGSLWAERTCDDPHAKKFDARIKAEKEAAAAATLAIDKTVYQ